MGCFSFRDGAEEDERLDHPDDRDEYIDRPFQFRVFPAGDNTRWQSNRDNASEHGHVEKNTDLPGAFVSEANGFAVIADNPAQFRGAIVPDERWENGEQAGIDEQRAHSALFQCRNCSPLFTGLDQRAKGILNHLEQFSPICDYANAAVLDCRVSRV